MSEHELLVPCPFKKGVERGNTAERMVYDGIWRSLPLDEKHLWQAIFAQEFVPCWVLSLLNDRSAWWERRYDYVTREEYSTYELHPMFLDAFRAGLKEDWTEFDSVLGIWELSEAKD